MPIIFAQAILFLPTFITGFTNSGFAKYFTCLLYTSDDADDLLCVNLGGRRII